MVDFRDFVEIFGCFPEKHLKKSGVVRKNWVFFGKSAKNLNDC